MSNYVIRQLVFNLSTLPKSIADAHRMVPINSIELCAEFKRLKRLKFEQHASVLLELNTM